MIKSRQRADSPDRQLWTHVAIAPWDGQRLAGRAMLVRRFRCNAAELVAIGPRALTVGDTFALRGVDLPWSKTPTRGTVVESRELPDRQNFLRLQLL